VANGVVYYGSFDYSVAALTGHVYALNASTGAQLWSFETGGPVTSSPAVANGVVYISSNGNLYALNASTGAKMWSYAAANIVDSPTVVNGVVYIICEPGPLLALNASTGAKMWSYSPKVQAIFLVRRPPWPMGWCISAPWTATATCMR
jgi:outer membrane protein assembly factor BamB